MEISNQMWADAFAKMGDRIRSSLVIKMPARDVAAPVGLKPVEVTQDMALEGACILESRLATGRWAYLDDAATIFRAMHAAAPVPLVSDAEIALAKEREEAYWYLRTVFEHVAPQCSPLPNLIGVCTQIDNVIAGLRMTPEPRYDCGPDHVAALAKERDGWKELHRNAEALRQEKIHEIMRLREERDEARADCRKFLQDHQDTMGVVGQLDAEIETLTATIAARDGRIRALQRTVDTYAQSAATRMTAEGYAALMADVPKPAPDPKPLPAQALAPPKGDARRVGG